MSDASPETPAPPPQRPPTSAAAQFRVDPWVVVLAVGAIVLLAALYWLLSTPRVTRADVDAARIGQIERRFDALDGLREQTAALTAKVEQLGPLENRLRAVEERPGPPDLRPLETQIARLNERAGAIEGAAGQTNERAIANERRLTALEGRPVFDPAAVPERAAFDALATRVGQLSERLEANTARFQNIEGELTRRLQEAVRAQEERLRAAEQAAGQRVSAVEQQLGQRVAASETQAAQRAAALEAQVGQRLGSVESSLGQRLEAAERSLQRLTALEGRTARLAAVDALQRALTAGQPLGGALGRVDDPPQALARYAQTAPPTEASLRLSFEDAARAARAASDAAASLSPQPDGQRPGVVDSALARLSGLVTVRRGEQVVWGDAAEAELERARRALDAGDLEGSLAYIGKLPPAARAAMDNWTEQARALIAARNALRQIAGTAG
ncbi:MAG: hypothetical protein ICV73_04435 [Acetobacteraceae bacterium]|nr:hypothetical protein [Acetobacteraceae bacterium]